MIQYDHNVKVYYKDVDQSDFMSEVINDLDI